MKFNLEVLEGKLLRRYKRFFADVDVGGKTLQVLVPNTGSMKGCNEAQSLCRITYVNNPERKIPYTLEMVKSPTSWVGVNTARPNKMVRELWESSKIASWTKFDRLQGEVKISEESRIDFVMWNSKVFDGEKLVKPNFKKMEGPFHFVEVKNVSLGENGVALFPDSVTLRGQKHIDEMLKLIKLGHTAEMLYVVQREDCRSFSPADEIDPEYGKKLRKAAALGLRVTALPCKMSSDEIVITAKPLKVML